MSPAERPHVLHIPLSALVYSHPSSLFRLLLVSLHVRGELSLVANLSPWYEDRGQLYLYLGDKLMQAVAAPLQSGFKNS